MAWEICINDWHWPAEEMAFSTVHRRGLEARKTERVRGTATWSLPGQSHRSITASPRAPPDGRIILHKCLREKKKNSKKKSRGRTEEKASKGGI